MAEEAREAPAAAPFDLDKWCAGRRGLLLQARREQVAAMEQAARHVEQINGQLLQLEELDKARGKTAGDPEPPAE